MTFVKTEEITPFCRIPDVAQNPTSNCPSGPISSPVWGVEKAIFTCEYEIGKNIGWAIVGVGTCCRDGNTNTLSNAGSHGYWIQAAINTNLSNNSVKITSPEMANWCINKENYYSFDAVDSFDPKYIAIDGNYIVRDSISYELYQPFSTSAASSSAIANLQNPKVPYQSGLNANQFLFSNYPIEFNKGTGLLKVIPSKEQMAQIAVIIREYRAIPNTSGNGYTRQLVGYVTRDAPIQVYDYCNQLEQIGIIMDSSNLEYLSNPTYGRTCRAKDNKVVVKIKGPYNSPLKVKDISLIDSQIISNYSFSSSIKKVNEQDEATITIKFDRKKSLYEYFFKFKVYYCNSQSVRVETYIPIRIGFNNASIQFEQDTFFYCVNSGGAKLELPLAKKVRWNFIEPPIGTNSPDSNILTIQPTINQWFKASNLSTPQYCSVNDSIYVQVLDCNQISGNIYHDINNNCTKELFDVPAKCVVTLKGKSNGFFKTIYTENNGNFSFTPPKNNDYELTLNLFKENCNPLLNKKEIYLGSTPVVVSIPLKDSAIIKLKKHPSKRILSCINDAEFNFNIEYLKYTGYVVVKFERGDGSFVLDTLSIIEEERVRSYNYTYTTSGRYTPKVICYNFNGNVLSEMLLDTIDVTSCLDGLAYVDLNENCSYDTGSDYLLKDQFVKVSIPSRNKQLPTVYTDDEGKFRVMDIMNGLTHKVEFYDTLSCISTTNVYNYQAPTTDTVNKLNFSFDVNKIEPSVEMTLIELTKVVCEADSHKFQLKINKSIGFARIEILFNDSRKIHSNIDLEILSKTIIFSHKFIDFTGGNFNVKVYSKSGKLLSDKTFGNYTQKKCLSGYLFIDIDSSCSFTPSDSPCINCKVTLSSNNKLTTVFTNQFGYYQVAVDSSEFINVRYPATISCGLTGSTIQYSFSDFPSIDHKTLLDYELFNYTVNASVAGKISNVDIFKLKLLSNTNYQIPSVLKVFEIELPSNISKISAGGNTICDKSKGTLIVSSTNNTVPSINFEFNNVKIGDSFCFRIRLRRVGKEKDTSDNIIIKCFKSHTAYDPNNKLADIKSRINDEEFIDKTNHIHYTVNFQNEGKAAAKDIYIMDTLSDKLDINSLEIVSFSHPMSTTLTDDKILRFDFKDIILPEKSVNEEKSKGYVNYIIKPKEALQINDEIRNQTHIYFDVNPAISTNTTVSRLVKPRGMFDFFNVDLDVYPKDAGTAYGKGNFLFGETVAIDAKPNQGFKFKYWVEGGVVRTVSEALTFKSDKHRKFTAHFTKSVSSTNTISADAVKVYPNPSSDFIYINHNLAKPFSVKISSIDGKTVTQLNSVDKIDIRNFPVGLYTIEIESENIRFIDKIIKE